MMKNSIFLLLLFLNISTGAFAQSRAVVASGGGESRSTGLQLNWTLGEAAVATIQTPAGNLLTEGFQQPDMLRVEPADHDAAIYSPGESATVEKITIAPNPVQVALTIHIPPSWSLEKLSVEVFDANAKLVQNGRIEPGAESVAWDMHKHPAGVYWLRIATSDARLSQTFKVVKVQ